MAKFFINRPIVAMVISILMVIVGVVAMVQLPIAQYPNIAPPEILLTATYPGADALTLEQSVATPIEQQMSGVDNMLYMYSTSQTSGSQMQLRVELRRHHRPEHRPGAHQHAVLAGRRRSCPSDVIEPGRHGQEVRRRARWGSSRSTRPKGTYDPLFLSNYAYINLNDPMTRVPGIGQVQIFGAGQYAMRLWVNPDTLAKLDITVNEIVSALQAQNTVNPAGQVGGEPVPPGQEFTYTVRAQGRLASVEEFENVVVRAKPDGSLVRVKDVARVELGAQTYNQQGRLNGRPAVDHRHLPAARLERHRHHAGRDEADGGGEGAVPARPRLRDGARHDAGRERRASTRSSRRSSRRSPWSSSSCSSSCRASAPR